MLHLRGLQGHASNDTKIVLTLTNLLKCVIPGLFFIPNTFNILFTP